MTMQTDPPIYLGQVERDPAGGLWAVLYRQDQVIAREQVRSLRQGKRRVTDMVLAAADATPIPAQARPAQGRNTLVRRVRDTPAGQPATPSGKRWRTAPAG
jgi:hypothetical protein